MAAFERLAFFAILGPGRGSASLAAGAARAAVSASSMMPARSLSRFARLERSVPAQQPNPYVWGNVQTTKWLHNEPRG